MHSFKQSFSLKTGEFMSNRYALAKRSQPPTFRAILGRMLLFSSISVCLSHFATAQETDDATVKDAANQDAVASDNASAGYESQLLDGTRQMTFAGRRAGEGYFSADGTQMVFQSERAAGNPFFQIYLMDLETGDLERVSPGHGKTTCAWIHPQGDRVLYASTQGDPEAKKKQKDEIELRESGKERRYSWDYDKTYDLIEWDRNSGSYKNLTNTPGYDAEGSYSPDGKWIAFASNRKAFETKLSDADQARFDMDPSLWMDIYLMKSDGSVMKQLTDVPGYDGGPFFSPDGKKICWRRFSENGATAEIMTMDIDGSNQRAVTKIGAMSWAPYFHPSGEYLIFATNVHGFQNFELYLIDAEGKSKPIRVTNTDGFDGLPVFTPNGKQLSWTSNRTSNKQSQIFIAKWNHEKARALLKLDQPNKQLALTDTSNAATAAKQTANETIADFRPQDILRHVGYLCRDELAGRMTGTKGELLATAYVAAYLDSLGLEPAGDDGGWYQPFDFTSGVRLGDNNSLAVGSSSYELKQDYVPIAFSKTGRFEPASVVFAGYGISAAKDGDQEEYDSFVHLDVENKWILCFRFMPEGISAQRRQHLNRFSSLRYKAMLARDRGAKGLIVVSGPNSNVKNELVKFRFDGSLSGASVPVISVTDELAASWLSRVGKNLKELQDKLDTGEPMMGFVLGGLSLSASIDVDQVKRSGRNVLGRLPASDPNGKGAVLIGAHIDHLGRGSSGNSLARDDEENLIHYGADDNASGVAGMLEIAEYLSDQKERGKLKSKRDVIFAAWSGEELGLIGSNHFVTAIEAKMNAHSAHVHAAHAPVTQKHAVQAADANKLDSVKHLPGQDVGKQQSKANPHTALAEAAHAHGAHAIVPPGIQSKIAACLNMDMIGRLEKNLILQGIGSSTIWKNEIEQRNVPVGLPITLQNDSYLPTDASSFFTKGVPILSAFTGAHSDYHTPRDTPDRLNLEGASDTSRLMGLIARSLAKRDKDPDYVAQTKPEEKRRARMRAYLGTIPNYAESDVKGVKLSGVAKNGPAEKSGIRAGDIIVELAGKKVENIYDYTYAIEALKIGQKTKAVVQRGNERVTLEVVPGSRE